MRHLDVDALRFPVHFIETLECLVHSSGGDTKNLRTVCGLPTDVQPEWLTFAQFDAMLRYGLPFMSTSEPFSFQLGRQISLTSHGTFSVAAMTSKTLGDALDVAVRYLPLVLPTHELHRIDVGNQVQVHIQCLHSLGSPYDEMLIETIPFDLYQMIRLADQAVDAVSGMEAGHFVKFAHNSPFPAAIYEEKFHLKVEFGSTGTYFSVPRQLLTKTLFTHNRTTHQNARDILDAQLARIGHLHSVSRKVAQIFKGSILGKNIPDAASVANTLGLSQRTLARRLSEEGVSFRGLLEKARIEKAEELLVTANPQLSRIADQLGYSNLPSFSRAFKRAKGVSPRHYVRQIKTD
ncbi:MAG: AraC family transcriptional regulator [Pseudomonadales bacterium]|nr:AraC family transcriptional regulator [Pseudomonadales bacterium]